MGADRGERRFPGLNDPRHWRILWQREGEPGCVAETPDRRRERMVEMQLRAREIVSPEVLRALGAVPRHAFVRPEDEPFAYEDRPLAIGEGQTISQPYIVALMTQLLHPSARHRVLEIGTGSGYQAAVLAEIVNHVFSVELSETLARDARRRLAALGYANVTIRCGDGHEGWAEHAPFDGIIVTCAAEEVPPALLWQLAHGGRLVIPLGPRWRYQTLWVMERRGEQIESRQFGQVVFVPFRKKGEQ